jgi:hypothetical protein
MKRLIVKDCDRARECRMFDGRSLERRDKVPICRNEDRPKKINSVNRIDWKLI